MAIKRLETPKTALEAAYQKFWQAFNDVSMPDEDDRVFYEVSLSQEDSFLVTGNLKHYPTSTRVITPAQFLEIV